MIAALSLVLLACPPALPPTGHLEGRWSGSMGMAGKPLSLLGWIQGDAKGASAVLHAPQIGAMALRMRVETSGSSLVLAGEVEGSPLTLEGNVEGDGYQGSWDWGGQVGTFRLTRTGALPPPYEEVPVTFSNGDVELAGTVLLPEGPGPFAAVVWTHGSGGIGRLSRTYVREAYTLALAGVASVIYDKRGVGQSTGDWSTSTFEQIARDAVAARQALLRFDRIDPARIGVGGISQASSWIAPLACSFDPAFAFAMVLSATGRTPAEQHRWVVECRLREAGFGDEAVATALDLHRRLNAWEYDGSGLAELEVGLAGAQAEPWFASSLLPTEPAPLPDHVRSWLWLDPVPLWEATDVVAFACWGDADKIVNPVVSRPILADVLGDRATSYVLPGADHGLYQSGPQPALVAPDLHPLMLSWLRAHGFAPH